MKKGEAFDIVQPNAGALIESLRAFGYTPESAVADLADNSITDLSFKLAQVLIRQN